MSCSCRESNEQERTARPSDSVALLSIGAGAIQDLHHRAV